MSYLSIPIILSKIGENDNIDFKIVTPQKSIYQFLISIFDADKVILLDYENVNLSNPIEYFKNKRIITHLFQNLKSISSQDVYFFHVAFGFVESCILTKLESSNRIYYFPVVELNSTKKHLDFKSLLISLFLRIAYKVDYDFVGESKKIPQLNSHFLRRVNAKPTKIEINRDVIAQILKNKLDVKIPQIVIATGGVVENGFVDIDTYISQTDKLLDSLNEFDFALKLHPRFNRLFSGEMKCKTIQSNLPLNLLLSQSSVLISFASATLFEHANQGGVSISLIDYYLGQNNTAGIDTYRLKDYLNSNAKRKINFPKTKEEIVRILKESTIDG